MSFAFSSQFRRGVRKYNFAAISIIQEQDNPYFRVQSAANVGALVASLQPGTAGRWRLVHLTWVPGLVAARTITVASEKHLAGYSIASHWLCAELEEISGTIQMEAARMRCQTWSHPEMIRRLHDLEMQAIDRFIDASPPPLELPRSAAA